MRALPKGQTVRAVAGNDPYRVFLKPLFKGVKKCRAVTSLLGIAFKKRIAYTSRCEGCDGTQGSVVLDIRNEKVRVIGCERFDGKV